MTLSQICNSHFSDASTCKKSLPQLVKDRNKNVHLLACAGQTQQGAPVIWEEKQFLPIVFYVPLEFLEQLVIINLELVSL